jgi:phage-related protein
MERLLADAQKLTGVEYNIDNLGDVYDAVHAIQDNLGLTGVAAQEAATTFSGSFGAMKAAAENVLANLSTGGDVEGSMQQLAQSAGTFLFDNLIPMVGNVVSAIPGALGSFISTAAPLIAEQGKAIIDNLIGANGQPDIITRAGEIISNIISGITQKIQDFATIAPEIMSTIATGITNAIPTVIEKGSEIINGIRDSLAENIPILWESATTIVSNIAEKIAEAYPTIIEKGAELISTIADAIVEHLPDLASSAVDIINSIGDFLAENIPTLASKVAEFMSNMGRTIVTNIPVVVGAIAKAAPTVLSAIGRIGLSIIQNIIKLIPKIASAGLQIISGLARGMGGAALGLVKTAMDNIKKAIEKPIQDAKDTLSGILDGIKGFFPISIGKILDNISLPHFTVDGGEFPYGVGGKGHMPSFGVDWYAKAMDQPYMFNRASLIGVGEAGDEMVYGRKALMDDIREAAGGGRNVTINVTVNGTDNPEQWATRLVRQMELEVRTA